MAPGFKTLYTLALFSAITHAQITVDTNVTVTGISPTATQAILRYNAAAFQRCSLKVADMDRGLRIAQSSGAEGQVTVTTPADHGLRAGTIIYIENSGVTEWDGWQTIGSVPTPTTFQFTSTAAGATSGGRIGVLVDDVNPALFPGSDQDDRPGNLGMDQAHSGEEQQRAFVIGRRTSEIAADGNRYSRALQANARHHFTLTCLSQTIDEDFTTQNLPVGDTHNEGAPVDRSAPGQYAYPTIQWSNPRQTLIDPFTGLRSFRSSGLRSSSSDAQSFVTVRDPSGTWENAAAPLQDAGGSAAFRGPCAAGSCPLLLRADNLSVYGGATYTTPGASLDWVTVTISRASVNGQCSGDDCKIVACLTVNGVTCASASQEVTLTSTPTWHTIGTGEAMDLWQGAGSPGIARPDVSQATGSVNYTAATRTVTLASGSPFSIKWTAGSRIALAGAEYPIASVLNERQLVLASGPAGNLSQAAYSANNFGVLIWKKTASTDRISIGHTTYAFGSSAAPLWASSSVGSCSPAVGVSGVAGYNCFVDKELYWIAADGSDIRDLGRVGLSWWNDGRWSTSWSCNTAFDPVDGDTWYCLLPLHFDAGRQTIVKAHYNGAHESYTPGQQLPDCGLNGGATPCVQFTIMQPKKSDSVGEAALAFSTDYRDSGYQAGYWLFGGISDDGEVAIYTREPGGQDTKGWTFLFTLGDRTPAGTGPNSFQMIAAASSYRTAPASWCAIHASLGPQDGMQRQSVIDLSSRGPSGTYRMTLTSPALTATAGAPGGPNVCPENALGVTGIACTAITVSGEPTQAQDGSVLQATQAGDLIKIDNEYLRILAKLNPTSLLVQRGFVSSVAAHSGTTLTMACGTRNARGAAMTAWDYRNDPHGRNTSRTTVVSDPNIALSHTYDAPGLQISSAGAWYLFGESVCPTSLLTTTGNCYAVRLGRGFDLLTSAVMGVAMNPPFQSRMGVGNPNQVDSHPGPCFESWCLDARPMDGGPNGMLGSQAAPFVSAGGQLWKFAAGPGWSRKTLTTLAYVGRAPLLDISGPGSAIQSGAEDSYKYCHAMVAGECVAGSAAGDVYVNAPHVSYPYCYYPGIAILGDDVNGICIGDLGAFAGNVVQIGVTAQDSMGARTRRLGPNYGKWNQQDVFWNVSATPNGGLMFSQARWLDGARHENLITILPPYPPPDGISRSSFIPTPVDVKPPPSLPVHDVVVEFGYAENGPPDSLFCTSRQETCAATNTTQPDAAPFAFAQTETVAGVPCATGCTVNVPALSQHILYYRRKYRDASGVVVATSPLSAIATP